MSALIRIAVVGLLLGLLAPAAHGAVIVGAQTVQTGSDSNAAGVAEAFRVSATSSGQVATLGVYVDTGSSATRLVAGLYADASGRPGALLGQGSLNAPTSAAWNTVTLGTPASVTSGTNYWIAILGPSGNGTLRFRDRCCAGNNQPAETSQQTTLTTLPATWTRGTVYMDGPASLYGATLDGPALAVAPASLAFSGVAGGTDPAAGSLSVTNGGSESLSWTAADDQPWLSVSPASGAAPGTVQVSVDSDGLAAGSYTGAVTVTAAGAQGSPRTVPVTLTLSAQADTTPPAVSLTAPAAGATVSGNVAVSATATDAGGVAGVRFRLDGQPLGAEDTTSPYGVSWDTTAVVNGSHTLTAVARDQAGNTATATAVTVTVQNTSGPAATGQWGPVLNWPLTSVHMVLMPTGQVLTFDAWDNSANSHRLWNPNNGTFVNVPYGLNIFCGGQTTLGDGRSIIVGGHVAAYVGTKDTTIFDTAGNTWTAKSDMFRSRWYPTATALPDGRVFSISGDAITQGKPINRLYDSSATVPEIYDPATDTWTLLNSAAREVRLYPFIFPLPDGRLLDAGPFMQSQFLDLGTGTWTPGPISQIDGHTAVQYRPGKIMKSGTASDPDFPNLNVTDRTVVLDTTAANPQWREVGRMANPRTYHNLVLLPDGSVLAAGGGNRSDGINGANAVTAAEIWDPATEQWTTMASEQRPRLYHSTGLLLPDGRVLMAGGGALPGSGAVDQANAEVFSPPYLFKGPRPTITSAPSTATYGSSFTVATPDASRIRSVALIRTGASTHSVDMSQNYVPLTFTAGANGLLVQAPGNGNVATPGVYMLFIVDDQGVPSVASFVRLPVPAQSDTTPPAVSLTAPAAGATVSGTVQLTASATDAGGVAGVQFRLDGQPLGAEDTSSPYGVGWDTTGASNGSHTLTAVARDAAGNTATASAVTVTVQNTPPDTTAPAVSLTAPAAGATVSGTVAVNASATDAVGVAGVQFRLDGQPLGAEDTSAPYGVSWNTTGAANGSHTLTAVARDAAGNTATATAVSVTVQNAAPDQTPPAVSLTAPAAGATVSGSVQVTANATDAVGVAGVQFRLDGQPLGAEDTSSPYAVGWDTTGASNGSHTLTAIARDAAGNTATATAVSVTVQNAAPGGGLVAAYGFEETTGTAVTDSSGRGNAGTLVGGTGRSTTGRIGRGLTFDGVNDHVNVPDANSLDLTTGMTLEAWVNPTALGATWRTLIIKESPGYFRYALYAHNGANGPSGHVFTNSDLDAIASSALPLNTWTHLATTYDGATVRLYVNGTQVATRAAPGTMTASTNALKIGGNAVWAEWFRGAIDEVRVYDRALSATEISADMTRAVRP